MNAWDLFAADFPHSTPEGFDRGCRGAGCPGVLEHGISCRDASRLSHSDYRYRKLAAAGQTPGQIASALRPAADTKPVARQARVIDEDEDLDDGVDIEQEEVIMDAPTPRDVRRKSPAGPPQSDVRAWAKANGVEVNTRGAVRADVVDAYLAAHAPLPEGKPADLPEPPAGAAAVLEQQLLDEARASVELDQDEDVQTLTAAIVTDPEPVTVAEQAEALDQIRERIADDDKGHPEIEEARFEPYAPTRTFAEWLDIRVELVDLIDSNADIAADEATAVAEAILLAGWEKA